MQPEGDHGGGGVCSGGGGHGGGRARCLGHAAAAAAIKGKEHEIQVMGTLNQSEKRKKLHGEKSINVRRVF
ncbi:unnamed protein product [Spirodela intermedia]|uniref:Uncharacterized protein n=1 Tax=Spirodela intermedia TaxID=51605 RepID=A0A7I8IS05_SPIIN|nr:unnamed protein product [Spirodela intermedia]CAA6660566.1 unnamed protein product [Spirodela intermedia]